MNLILNTTTQANATEPKATNVIFEDEKAFIISTIEANLTKVYEQISVKIVNTINLNSGLIPFEKKAGQLSDVVAMGIKLIKKLAIVIISAVIPSVFDDEIFMSFIFMARKVYDV